MDPLAKKKLKKTFSQRNFGQCISIFKKFFDDTTLDSETASMVGISYLYKFDFKNANKYLNISLHLDKTNITSLMAIAALNLKQRNLDTAIEYYLKIIDIDGNNKMASKILNRLKRSDNIDKLIRKMRFNDYLQLPPLHVSILSVITLIMILSVMTLLIIILLMYVFN